MSKKKKQSKETTISNYYDLKTKEVDELVAALKDGNSNSTSLNDSQAITTDIQEITGEEVKGKSKKAKNFDPYKRDFLSAVPVPIKAIFIKWWFSGCVCYFFMMGLGINMDSLDLLAINGVVLGLVNELLVNPLFRFLESDKKEYNWYMMFPFSFKAYWTFLTNILYYALVVVGVGYLYYYINTTIVSTGVEPLLFGTFCVIVDMAFIGIKDAIVLLVRKLKKKKREIPDV
jgi:hypothetical protein